MSGDGEAITILGARCPVSKTQGRAILRAAMVYLADRRAYTLLHYLSPGTDMAGLTPFQIRSLKRRSSIPECGVRL